MKLISIVRQSSIEHGGDVILVHIDKSFIDSSSGNQIMLLFILFYWI